MPAEEVHAVHLLAPRHRRAPGLKERPYWWRTRCGRSYKLHTAAVPVRTGADAAAPAGADRHCGRAFQSQARTAMVYTLLDQYYLPGHVTHLLRQECGEVAAMIRLGQRQRREGLGLAADQNVTLQGRKCRGCTVT